MQRLGNDMPPDTNAHTEEEKESKKSAFTVTKPALHITYCQSVAQPQTNSIPVEGRSSKALFIPHPPHWTRSEAIIIPFIEIHFSILLQLSFHEWSSRFRSVKNAILTFMEATKLDWINKTMKTSQCFWDGVKLMLSLHDLPQTG